MSIEKHSLDGTNSAIYAETANLNYFLKETLEPDSVDGVTNVSQSVKTHTRRRYAGDSTPANVSAHSRTVLVDPGRRNGSATPGKQMILSDGIETRQFTYTGPWTDVHSFLVANAAMDLFAYSASARYKITVAEAGLANAKIR